VRADRLDRVLSSKVRRDGANATDVLIELIAGSKFREHVRAVLLQGIGLAASTWSTSTGWRTSSAAGHDPGSDRTGSGRTAGC